MSGSIHSPAIDSRFIGKADPYVLLRSYAKEAKIKSKAYGYSEGYYRWVYKVFTYPTVLISAVSSVFAMLHVNEHVLLGLSLTMLLLTGYNSTISPKDKEQRANQIKTEFAEISRNVKQFLYENNKSFEEIKAYSETINELMNVWNSLSPPLQDKYLNLARTECESRTRNHDNLKKTKKLDITIQ